MSARLASWTTRGGHVEVGIRSPEELTVLAFTVRALRVRRLRRRGLVRR